MANPEVNGSGYTAEPDICCQDWLTPICGRKGFFEFLHETYT